MGTNTFRSLMVARVRAFTNCQVGFGGGMNSAKCLERCHAKGCTFRSTPKQYNWRATLFIVVILK